MISKEKLNLIRFSRTETIGPITFFRLMENYNQDIEKILCYLKNEKKLKIPSEKDILQEISALNDRDGEIITYLDDEYPQILKTIEDFPPVISVLGDLSNEIYAKNRAISIVGSRNCSISGKKFTKYIVKELVDRNFITISGLANGIDETVHQETIDNNGKTIAVLGSGLGYLYPNTRLAEDIVKSGGIVISEMPFFEKPRPQYFPRRNRIIAGLSMSTLVIEAGSKSGSMITANLAAKYGRTVFAVPGFPMDERSTGTNQLIKDGAVMARDIEDILEELKDFYQQEELFGRNDESIFHKKIDPNTTELEKRILNALDQKSETSLNDLLRFIPEIDQSAMLIAITELEIKNLIERDIIGRIILV